MGDRWPIYLDHAADLAAKEKFRSYYKLCRDVPRNDPERCFEEASQQYDTVPHYTLSQPENVAVVSLVPVVLGWLLASALVYLVRWIRAGFKPSG